MQNWGGTRYKSISRHELWVSGYQLLMEMNPNRLWPEL